MNCDFRTLPDQKTTYILISKSLFRATFDNLNEGPDCEPGLVFDAIHVEDSSLVPRALLVGPAQHKSEQLFLQQKNDSHTAQPWWQNLPGL